MEWNAELEAAIANKKAEWTKIAADVISKIKKLAAVENKFFS